MDMVICISMILCVIGGVNWGLWGMAKFDLVAALCGGNEKPIARLVYSLVGVSAVIQLLSMLEVIGSAS
ncbi:MAG: DUF378 domain-containing protein [Phycisphaerae bacterium]|nr:DUF378 domain-containing protein [Phycisphaerae bacterium]|tara:strand:- start:2464 stop:2670 length:207 start_codon:yes stop_codon:yes gene_type:complete